MTNIPLPQRFWAKVAIASPDDCWEWQASRTKGQYGQFKMDNARVLAHRVAYLLSNGPIPEGLLVLHRCDNPPCCNPAHLSIGTGKDNTRDMIERKRNPDFHGEKGANCKLTTRQVIEIRELHAQGTTEQTEIARRFHVTPQAINLIVKRRNWKHI